MDMVSLFALALSSTQPLPINEALMQEIGCVAIIGLIAHDQRAGGDALQRYGDIRQSGKKWAGIVGDRIMFETGQPRELVAAAFKAAVDAEQEISIKMETPEKSAAYVRTRFDQCKPMMDMQLAKADGAEPAVTVGNSPSMLAPEPKWATDEPKQIALYRQQLREDLASPQNIRHCNALIGMSADEISGREGEDSRDAKAFVRLAKALSAKVQSLPDVDQPEPATADDLPGKLQTEAEKEEIIARCIRLGESLALASAQN